MSSNAKIGGILSIVSGAMGALCGLFIAGMGVLFSLFSSILPGFDRSFSRAPFPVEGFTMIFTVVYGVMGLGIILVGALAIVGGVFALKKHYWGVALAGSIAGTYVFFPCGIASTIFISMARPEFQNQVAEGTEINAWEK
jgi:hypothetical protein